MQADVPAWAPEGREGRSQEAIADQGRPWQIKAFWNPRCYQHLWCLLFQIYFRIQQWKTNTIVLWQDAIGNGTGGWVKPKGGLKTSTHWITTPPPSLPSQKKIIGPYVFLSTFLPKLFTLFFSSVKFFTIVIWLRETCPLKYGWIPVNSPNGLWPPPPLLWKIYCIFFTYLILVKYKLDPILQQRKAGSCFCLEFILDPVVSMVAFPVTDFDQPPEFFGLFLEFFPVFFWWIYTRSSCICGGFSSNGYLRAARFFGFPAWFFWISSWISLFWIYTRSSCICGGFSSNGYWPAATIWPQSHKEMGEARILTTETISNKRKHPKPMHHIFPEDNLLAFDISIH